MALAARRVHLHEARVLHDAFPRLTLRIRCGPGYYVRALARDLGEAVGCGAYLSRLRRLETGGFDLGHACPPEEIELDHALGPAQVLSRYPRLDVGPEEARRLGQGQALRLGAPDVAPDGLLFAWHDDAPLCRLRRLDDGAYRPALLVGTPPPSSESA